MMAAVATAAVVVMAVVVVVGDELVVGEELELVDMMTGASLATVISVVAGAGATDWSFPVAPTTIAPATAMTANAPMIR